MRGGLAEIFEVLKGVKNLRVLDIVDNNLDASSYSCNGAWQRLSELIKIINVEEVYIGTRRIMGSSSSYHSYFDEGKAAKEEAGLLPRSYHNTGWGNDYYGTGFNELVLDSEQVIENALKQRKESEKPLSVCFLISSERTSTAVMKNIDGNFSYDRSINNPYTYEKQEYTNDESSPQRLSSLLAQTAESVALKLTSLKL